MKLNDLKKELPYKWRVQSFSKFAPKAQCVSYIDARDVMDLLDEVCGADNWQDAFKNEGGMLFAGIGIKCGEDWVFKWDTGSESNIEKEKGHSSDAFKRAGVKWGIGRFLYSLKIQNVITSEKKADGKFPFVVDQGGNRVWDLTKYINDLNGKTPVAPKTKTKEELATRFQTCKNKFELENAYKKYKVDVDALPAPQAKAIKALVNECKLAHEREVK